MSRILSNFATVYTYSLDISTLSEILLYPFFSFPDETYYGNFVASHPIPHFGSCAHQGIEKIQPSM